MCLSNEAAAIKLAERDNLVGELVEALQFIFDDYEQRKHYTDEWADAALVYATTASIALAKAREGAQS